MQKIWRHLERICVFYVVILPVLALLDILSIRDNILQEIFPLPVSFQIEYAIILIITSGSYLYFVALVILFRIAAQRRNLAIEAAVPIVGILVGIPMCFLLSFAALGLPEKILGSTQSKDFHYFVSAKAVVGENFLPYYFYKCDQNDMKCKMIDSAEVGSYGGNNEYPVEFIIDNRKSEIHFFIGRSLIFTDSSAPHEYRHLDFEFSDPYIFSLYSYQLNELQQLLITKCKGTGHDYRQTPCEIIPFRYATETFYEAKLITDEKSNEIRLTIDEQLIFTYDTAPYCHAEGCVITDN